VIAETLTAEIAVQALFVLGPMRGFMQGGAVIGLPILECLKGRQLDDVAAR
jgi:hypothetical protein